MYGPPHPMNQFSNSSTNWVSTVQFWPQLPDPTGQGLSPTRRPLTSDANRMSRVPRFLTLLFNLAINQGFPWLLPQDNLLYWVTGLRGTLLFTSLWYRTLSRAEMTHEEVHKERSARLGASVPIEFRVGHWARHACQVAPLNLWGVLHSPSFSFTMGKAGF